jgi:hypothetical protein
LSIYLDKVMRNRSNFLYETRIGFGLAIRGTGESVATRESAADTTSSLKFASQDWKSLIREGAGYWKYVPTNKGLRFFTVPLYRNMAEHHVSRAGRDVPFTIENYAYRDSLGRETMSWVRTFNTVKKRRFDAYMVYSVERGCIVDYLGTHQHLAVDLEVSVAESGGIRIRSGEQRFYEGMISFRFPALFSGIADVCEWYDDAEECFRIEVNASNSVWGPLFGYSGRFQAEWTLTQPGYVPPAILPKRVECRE